jgi:hypothetical protein
VTYLLAVFQGHRLDVAVVIVLVIARMAGRISTLLVKRPTIRLVLRVEANGSSRISTAEVAVAGSSFIAIIRVTVRVLLLDV